MLPQIQIQLLALAQTVALILANRLTPDSVRQILLKCTRELRDTLPMDSKKDVEAAEAEAIIRAVAYRRDD